MMTYFMIQHSHFYNTLYYHSFYINIGQIRSVPFFTFYQSSFVVQKIVLNSEKRLLQNKKIFPFFRETGNLSEWHKKNGKHASNSTKLGLIFCIEHHKSRTGNRNNQVFFVNLVKLIPKIIIASKIPTIDFTKL